MIPQLHSRPGDFWRYLLPRRLTLKSNPAIYRWTFWVWQPKGIDA